MKNYGRALTGEVTLVRTHTVLGGERLRASPPRRSNAGSWFNGPSAVIAAARRV